MKQKLFSVWEGVYKTFEEAGGDIDAFDSDIWIQKQRTRVLEGIKTYKNGASIAKDYPLPIVVAMLLSQKSSVKILDFGGVWGCSI